MKKSSFKIAGITAVLLFIFMFSSSFAQSKKEIIKKDVKTECDMKMDNCCSKASDAKMKTSDTKPFNKYCPVRGEEVDTEVATVKYNGKNYGFCCKGCDKKFSNNPEKYSKNLSEDGQEFLGK